MENILSLKGKDKENFEASKELALTCKKMVTILRDAPIEISLDETKKKEVNFDKLREFYEYLELPSLLRELNKLKPQAEVYNMSYRVIDNPIDISDALDDNSSLIFESSEYNYHRANLLYIGLKNKKVILLFYLICYINQLTFNFLWQIKKIISQYMIIKEHMCF